MSRWLVAPPGLPSGRHKAVLDRCEDAEHRDFGPGVKWFFRNESGEESHQWTGCEMRPGNALHRLAESLAGHKLPTGTPVDPDDFVGRTYEVVVGADGRITKISPVTA
jgi:hypothetical protein